MRKLLIALAGAALLTLGSAHAAEEAKAPLSDEAKQALSKAEADVKEAREKKGLWTTAQDALKKAKEAAENNDSATVIKESRIASEHARLGIQQTSYPPVNQ